MAGPDNVELWPQGGSSASAAGMAPEPQVRQVLGKQLPSSEEGVRLQRFEAIPTL